MEQTKKEKLLKLAKWLWILVAGLLLVWIVSLIVHSASSTNCGNKDRLCLLERNHQLQAENSYALAEAKDTYLKAKLEYEQRQDTRATLQNQEDYIINSDTTQKTGFIQEQTSSEINQSIQPAVQTVK